MVDSIEFDLIICGSGLAGLRAAIEAAKKNSKIKIGIVSKVQVMRSHSVSAEGGTAAVLFEDEGDTIESHICDTVKGSDFLADQGVAQRLCEEIPKEILAQIKLQKQEPKAKSKPDSFDELKRKLEFVLDDPEDVKDLLVRYGFDEMIKHDIQRKITEQETEKTAEKYANYMVNLWKTDPSKVLELRKIRASSPTKTTESRHESPSKIPLLVTKDVRIVKTPKI